MSRGSTGQIIRPAAEQLMRGGLAHDAQTPDGERDLEDLLRGLAWQNPDRG
ncbi:hypothetical protein [Streptomyces sp. SPB4]|uniref:hypothetical protein n=1 Tax=Streptomyces TaxID=1883 RepID=UPI002476C65F|nr:hypothetical protein [Streptomyces sp. SPB4]MDH6545691.1 hypothetical protein [Streptomyces sp. SPB4]MDH6545706.1 hypothetical protein [Streptomyces sp. SPB4]